MPDNDRFRRYLEAGAAFTELTRRRAEGIVRDLVHSGEVSREQATARVEELLEHSQAMALIDLNVKLWDPSSQLRFKPKRTVPPRPDGAPNAAPADWARPSGQLTDPPPERTPETVAAGWGD